MQGVWDEGAKEYVLIDPAIHCPSDPMRFTSTNLMLNGVDTFFITHECNAHCAALRLRKHPKQVDKEAVGTAATRIMGS